MATDHMAQSVNEHVDSDRDRDSLVSQDDKSKYHEVTVGMEDGTIAILSPAQSALPEQRDEPSNPFVIKEDVGNSRLQIQEPSGGSHDPSNENGNGTGFIRPKRYARTLSTDSNKSSITSNEQIFPAWFASVSPEESKGSFMWSDSFDDDALANIEDSGNWFGSVLADVRPMRHFRKLSCTHRSRLIWHTYLRIVMVLRY
jgi:hypothetical protein